MTFPVSPKVWYRVDQITGLSNGAAAPSTLTDAAGNGFTATKVGSATYQTGATPTGNPILRFDGHTTPAGYNFGSLAGLTAASAFIVIKRAANLVNVGPWNLRSGDGSYYTYSDGKTYEGSFTNSGATRASFTNSRTDYHIFHVAVGGGTLTAYINNVQQATTTYTTFTPPTAPAIARTTTNGADTGWNGDIAEFVLFDSVLSSADRQSVVDELTTRHLTGSSAASGSASLSLTASGGTSAAGAGSASLSLSASGSTSAAAGGSASLSLSASGGTVAPSPASGSASLSLSASGGAAGDTGGSASLNLVASGTAFAVLAASGSATLTLTAAGSAVMSTGGTATLTLSATGAAVVLYETDLSNALDGLDLLLTATVTFAVPVVTPPTTLVVAHKVDKALAYPVPTMVGGRPT